ncbi:MAG: hypothetical protein U0989_02035 [Azonexus sp.]|nr:hypothetical protein [Azonexus sp.]MDZ4313547.1 hypothetical protein [Azonexus sp.]
MPARAVIASDRGLTRLPGLDLTGKIQKIVATGKCSFLDLLNPAFDSPLVRTAP